MITVGAGEILSVTSSEAELTSNATVVSTMPGISSLSGIAVKSDGEVIVFSGGSAAAVTLNPFASATVQGGGVASGLFVDSSASATVEGGSASGMVISAFGSATVEADGNASDTTVSSGGFLSVGNDGDSASGTVVSSGGELSFTLANSAVGPTLIDGISLQSGALVQLLVVAGGSVSGFVVSRRSQFGDLVISSGGSATGAIVTSGAFLNVEPGGTASGTIVSSGGQLNIISGGDASGSVIDSGGFVNLSLTSAVIGSGPIDGVTLESGAGISLTIDAGGSISGLAVNSGDDVLVFPSGSAIGAIITSGGVLEVAPGGGIASGSVVQSGGSAALDLASSASTATLIDGVNLLSGAVVVLSIDSGGSISGLVVGSHGSEFLFSGGNATGTLVDGGGSEAIKSGGAATGTVLDGDGARQEISGGGTATSSIVRSGGGEQVDFSATADGTQISAGGLTFIDSGGIASGVVVSSGGLLGLIGGAVTTGTVLESGGVIELVGVSATAATWSAGILTVTSGGTMVATLSLPGNFQNTKFVLSAMRTSPPGNFFEGTDISLGGGASSGGVSSLTIVTPKSLALSATKTAKVAGLGVTEKGAAASASFVVSLTDTSGLLTASGTGVIGGGTTSLTIAGTLAQVASDLKTVTDTEFVGLNDSLTISAVDLTNSTSASKTIAVTVKNGAPVIGAPAKLTLGVDQATAISGVSLSETGVFTGETFTVTVSDKHGSLSATSATSSSATSLTITGSLGTVITALATLQDTDSIAGADSIVIHALDSIHGTASKTIAVTANGLPTITAPKTLKLTEGKVTKVTGVSLKETGTTTGETFTVTVSDSSGVLSATGASGNGTTSLTITGSLATVNAALAKLTDTDGTATPDSIAITAADSFGNSVPMPKQIAVTVTVPAARPVVIDSASLQSHGGTAVFLGNTGGAPRGIGLGARALPALLTGTTVASDLTAAAGTMPAPTSGHGGVSVHEIAWHGMAAGGPDGSGKPAPAGLSSHISGSWGG